MYSRLVAQLESNHLFGDKQYRFYKNKYKVTALVNFTESVMLLLLWSYNSYWTWTNHWKLKNTKLLRYTIADCFARTEDRKWGVAIYANPKLKNKIKVGLSSVSGYAECIFKTILLMIELKKRCLHLMGIYRLLSSNLETAIDIW